MMKTTNECVGCVSVGLPCLGVSCPKRNVTRYYCDECDEEYEREKLRQVGHKHICQKCYAKLAAEKAADEWRKLKRPEEE